MGHRGGHGWGLCRLLCSAVGRWRHGFDTRWRRRINRGSALMLGGFALWPLLQLLR